MVKCTKAISEMICRVQLTNLMKVLLQSQMYTYVLTYTFIITWRNTFFCSEEFLVSWLTTRNTLSCIKRSITLNFMFTERITTVTKFLFPSRYFSLYIITRQCLFMFLCLEFRNYSIFLGLNEDLAQRGDMDSTPRSWNVWADVFRLFSF